MAEIQHIDTLDVLAARVALSLSTDAVGVHERVHVAANLAFGESGVRGEQLRPWEALVSLVRERRQRRVDELAGTLLGAREMLRHRRPPSRMNALDWRQLWQRLHD